MPFTPLAILGKMGTPGAAATTYSDGALLPATNLIEVYMTGTVAGGAGLVTFPTVNGTNPLFSTIYPASATTKVWNNTGLYNYSPPTLSADKKSITLTVKTMMFTTVSVAVVGNVLASATFAAAPDGTTVTLRIAGLKA